MLAKRALRLRIASYAPHGADGRGHGRSASPGSRRDPLLHGRGLAQSERPRSRPGLRDGERRQGSRHGNLRDAGLDFYNHNVDTSPEFYGRIITTRTLQDRIDTLAHVREAGIKVCCGGIVGMGERVEDRLGMLVLLANLPIHPESVPINLWNEVKGVPVNDTAERPDPIALVRLIAVARIMMPKSVVRLSAGRQYMTDELQALCFLAGANSIFIGDVLLTTKNPQRDRDANLLHRLGITSGLA